MFALQQKLSVWATRVLGRCRALMQIPGREPADFPFVASDVAQLHRLCSDPAGAAIDDATWKDLLLDVYCAQLSQEVSIFGQHALYQRLRAGHGAQHRASIEALLREPGALEQLHQRCKPLRHADQEIATLLHEAVAPPVPWWSGKTWPLMVLLIASVAAATLSPAAWLVTGLVLYLLMSTQMRYQDTMEQWQRAMRSLQMLLRVESLLDGPHAAQASKINRALTRAPVEMLIPGLGVYRDWFMLANVNHYFKGVGLVRDNLALLRACFARLANLEADIALARHLLCTPTFCWAVQGDARAIALRDTVHPLLAQAQPLCLELEGKGAFISGQNGIGKSTLLRTVGINLVAARAFGFCYATSATVPDLPVYASMQSEDAMLGGESLYMAELRRAQELLAASEGPHAGVCIIDEIFRGTNHLESVSAAASVLDVLAAKGLVIVSSHNLVLGSLLAHRLEPLCVARAGDGALTLSDGVLAHTNGIALLAQRGFGPQVEAGAGKVFDWLSSYLAHPADCSAVLA
ncbi:MAG: DNA mismatch repair protein MutS [Pseudomonadota bacterium]